MPRRAAIPLLLATACGPGTDPPRECEPAPLEHDGATPPPYEPPSIPSIDCVHPSALVPGPLQPLPTWPAPGDGNDQGSRMTLELSLERTDAGPWQQSATFSTYVPEVWEDVRFDRWRCGLEIDPLDDVDDCRVRAYYGIEVVYGIFPFHEPDLRPIEVHTPHWVESIPRRSSTYHHGVFASPPAWGDPYGISWASDGAGFPADSISPVAHLGRELVIRRARARGPNRSVGDAGAMVGMRRDPAAARGARGGDRSEAWRCRRGSLPRRRRRGVHDPDDAMRLVDPSWIAGVSIVSTVQRTHAIEGGTLFAEMRTVDTIELGAPR